MQEKNLSFNNFEQCIKCTICTAYCPVFAVVIYYDGAERAWNKGAEYAYDFKWKEAIEQWMTLLQSNGKEKKACAAYNIALGCFMCGQPDLALEWLDRSDSYEPVSLSKSLRIKIKQYTGKE